MRGSEGATTWLGILFLRGRSIATQGPSKVTQAKSLHNSIRDVLGSGYETFLQGSYRNDTGVADINDVDIVAIHKDVTSTHFTGLTFDRYVSWDTVFLSIRDLLEDSPYYNGKTELGDKCITVHTDFRADVVPAVRIGDVESDPISVYSWRAQAERKNYPRDHYENNVFKQAATNDQYKPTVRMFKQWARNWFSGTKVAPSFYVECLVYNTPNGLFSNDPVVTFMDIADHIEQNVNQYTYLPSVAGDKDILTESEWPLADFLQFQQRLEESVLYVQWALIATDTAEATRRWKKAFNE